MMNDTAPSGYVKLDKRIARKYYRTGYTLYLLPCKVRFHNDWIKPQEVNKSRDKDTLDHVVNDYEYYNCNSEVGYYTSFFIKQEDIENGIEENSQQ